MSPRITRIDPKSFGELENSNMKTSLSVILILLALGYVAEAAGLQPWQFGMTQAQVAGFKEYGPYKASPNGDLETFNGRFHGRSQNIHFFFHAGRLHRIGVYLGGSTNRDKTIASCKRLCEVMQRDYGPLRILEQTNPKEGGKAAPAVQAVAAAMNADLFGRTHIVPVKQPRDMHVSGEVIGANIAGQKMFVIVLFLDSL